MTEIDEHQAVGENASLEADGCVVEPGAGVEDLVETHTGLRIPESAVREYQQSLRDLGWPLVPDGEAGPRTFEATRDFQRGFAFWDLVIDGRVGPKTREALRQSLDHGGRCGPRFTFKEFKSKGNGWIKVARELVRGLEAYRDLIDRPVSLRSGYRDPAYNARVGGAPASQHLYGNAVDLAQHVVSLSQVRGLARFSGIGLIRANGKVLHLDVREVGPNTTGGTPRNPTVWYYG
jgi:peptidoglycan hydrolase-like protein with peptidoglycan-binding domain